MIKILIYHVLKTRPVNYNERLLVVTAAAVRSKVMLVLCADPEGRERGSEPPPLNNHQNIDPHELKQYVVKS